MNTVPESFAVKRPPGAADRHGRGDLEQWAERYRASVGEASRPCIDLLHSLLESGALDADAIDKTCELLGILESLSADPITISAAMVHVAAHGGADVSQLADNLVSKWQLHVFRRSS